MDLNFITEDGSTIQVLSVMQGIVSSIDDTGFWVTTLDGENKEFSFDEVSDEDLPRIFIGTKVIDILGYRIRRKRLRSKFAALRFPDSFDITFTVRL